MNTAKTGDMMSIGAFTNKLPVHTGSPLLPDKLPLVYLSSRLFFLKRSCAALALPVALVLSACSTMNNNAIPPVPPAPPAPPVKLETPPPSARPATAQHELRFAVAGDIMAHESQLHAAYNKECDCYDFKPVFATAAPLFKGMDVSIANFETTLPGKHYSGYPAFGAPDALVDAVKSAGINLLTTANNHCLDKGKDAAIRTLKVLDDKGIPHLGTYASQKDYEKRRIFLLRQNEITVAMLNYTYGTNDIPTPKGVVVNRINKEQISRDIGLAREKNVDAVIVLFHFGQEYLNKPDAYQRDMVAHALASGADIVLGGHPHHVQPYELLRRKDKSGKETPHLVAYSVGNFVSAQRERYTDGGMVLYFTLVKKQDAEGKTVIDITDVHHKLVWVYIAHHDTRKQFHILPIETHLASPGDMRLPQTAIDSMKRFKADIDGVLGVKVSELHAKQ